MNHVRLQWSEIPVVVISGSRSLDDKIAMLDAGADQYLWRDPRVSGLYASEWGSGVASRAG